MKPPRYTSPQLLLAALFVIVVGLALACATAPKGSATVSSSVEPSLQASKIKSVAAFPMRNVRLAPEDIREINRGMVAAFQKQNPDLVVLGPGEAVTKLNEASLADKYSEFLRNFEQSGIPDANILREIGKALGVDAILQGQVFDVTQTDGVEGVSYGRTSLNVRYTLQSTTTGTALWQASSRVTEFSKKPGEPAPMLLDVMKVGQERILTVLPTLAH